MLLSWMSLILPQMEQDNLWQTSVAACQADSITFHNPPHVAYATVVRAYACPADGRLLQPLVTPTEDRAAFTSYIGIAGTFGVVANNRIVTPRSRGVLGNSPGIRLTDITDGTSQTLMVGERPPPATLQAGVVQYHLPDGAIWWPQYRDVVPARAQPGRQTMRFGGVADRTGPTEQPLRPLSFMEPALRGSQRAFCRRVRAILELFAGPPDPRFIYVCRRRSG